jgi:hypothetical protein
VLPSTAYVQGDHIVDIDAAIRTKSLDLCSQSQEEILSTMLIELIYDNPILVKKSHEEMADKPQKKSILGRFIHNV